MVSAVNGSVKKIVQNTGFLYVRMLITMGIMLYTSRVLLDVLGAADYGLYHVLAGVVVLLGFLQGALSTMTQRFIAVELGRESRAPGELARIFSMSVNIHLLFALLLAAVALVLGYFWLLDLINYGDNSASTVFWVFVFSIGTFVMNLVVLPCHAVVIAHERMHVYAWFGISEAVLKLVIVFMLPGLAMHSLLAYALLLFGVALTLLLGYFIYVLSRFDEIRFVWFWDRRLFRNLASFTSWNVLGSSAPVFANQGTNVLLNVFFGPTLNAAKSLATQASGAVNQFVTNLQAAINPQLMKSYSAENKSYTDKLIYYGAKYNFFLIILLALPVITFTEQFLAIWLVEVPEYASLFLKLLLLKVTIESISKPLITAANATGKIRLYHVVVGGILLMNVPISYVALQFGAGPEWVFYIALALVLVAFVARILVLKRIYAFSMRRFAREVVWPVVKVSVVLLVVAQYVAHNFTIDSLVELLGATFGLLVVTLLSVVLLGFAANEKKVIFTQAKKVVGRGK